MGQEAPDHLASAVSAASVGVSFFKNLIGLDESLEEFQRRWAWGKESLTSKLKQERDSYQDTVVRIFKRADDQMKKFMVRAESHLATGLEDDLEEVLLLFNKKGVPGAGILSEGCAKQRAENILDIISEFFTLLEVEEMDGVGPVGNSEDEDEEEDEEEDEAEEEDEEEDEESSEAESSEPGSGSDNDTDDSKEEDEESDEEEEEDDEPLNIDEPVFLRDPDLDEPSKNGSDEEGDKEESKSKEVGPKKLSWKSNSSGVKEGPEENQEKQENPAIVLLRLDDEFEKWKKVWEDEKEGLEHEELDDNAKDYQVQILEVYNHIASPEAREFMESPFEDFVLDHPEEVEKLMKELDKLDVPGAPFLLEALPKFNMDKISEQVLDYFDLLKQENMVQSLASLPRQAIEKPEPEPEVEKKELNEPDEELIEYFKDAFIDDAHDSLPKTDSAELHDGERSTSLVSVTSSQGLPPLRPPQLSFHLPMSPKVKLTMSPRPTIPQSPRRGSAPSPMRIFPFRGSRPDSPEHSVSSPMARRSPRTRDSSWDRKQPQSPSRLSGERQTSYSSDSKPLSPSRLSDERLSSDFHPPASRRQSRASSPEGKFTSPRISSQRPSRASSPEEKNASARPSSRRPSRASSPEGKFGFLRPSSRRPSRASSPEGRFGFLRPSSRRPSRAPSPEGSLVRPQSRGTSPEERIPFATVSSRAQSRAVSPQHTKLQTPSKTNLVESRRAYPTSAPPTKSSHSYSREKSSSKSGSKGGPFSCCFNPKVSDE